MSEKNLDLNLILTLSKTQAAINRKFDIKLSIHGLGFSDFIVLYHLANKGNENLRRIDLAEKIGVTASGLTRILGPMEKMGLISRGTDKRDGRISYVELASGGKRVLEESMKTVGYITNEIFSNSSQNRIEKLIDLLKEIQKEL